MKRAILSILGIVLATGFLLAQGTVTVGGNRWQRFWGWKPTTPPPLTIVEAHALAVAHIGSATNRFYCVSANCLEMTNYTFRGWAFTFSDTNERQARVEISFDKELRIDLRSQELLHGKSK